MPILRQPKKAAALQLLHSTELPTADITETLLENFWVYVAEEKIVGLVGLELFSEVGLLRSLAVGSEHRNLGFGTQLVRQAEAAALQAGVRDLYLLTASAQEFFEALGYVRAARRYAPQKIRTSREFAELCPASSLLMKKTLSPSPSPTRGRREKNHC